MAKADFHVAGRPVFGADMQPIPGYQAITHTDIGRTLSVMTETYTQSKACMPSAFLLTANV